MEDLINKLERYIPETSITNPAVSNGAVGWHIAHCLLTIRVITDALVNSKPEEYKRDFNWKRTFVLALNKIPRGKIKAPSRVVPKEEFDIESLQQQVHTTREKIKALQNLAPRNYFLHPFLGNIRLAPARKFMLLHTNHHLKIIQDILSSR